MILKDLKVGHVFKTPVHGKNRLVVKLKRKTSDELISGIPISESYLVNLQKEVFPINKIEDYDETSIRQNIPRDIGSVSTGTVVWSGDAFGCPQLLLVGLIQNNIAVLVASFDEPTTFLSMMPCVDLGHIKNYEFIQNIDHIRTCPNCNNYSLVMKEMNSDVAEVRSNLKLICNTCRCKVTLTL